MERISTLRKAVVWASHRVCVLLCALSVCVPLSAQEYEEEASSSESGTSILTGLNDPDKIFGGSTAGAKGTSDEWYQLDRRARNALKDGMNMQAESLWKQAVGKAEASGKIDPGVVTCLVGLSYLNHLNGNFGESERLYEYAMRDVEGTTGRESSQFIQYIPDLAWLYNEHGKPEKAEVLLKHALKINERAFGPQSSQSAECLEQYGEFLRKLKRNTEARQYDLRAKNIRSRLSQQKNERDDLERESSSSSTMEITDEGSDQQNSQNSDGKGNSSESSESSDAGSNP